ncbi:MAG: hypothetical protein ACI3ZN_01955 [Candidatus Cryptobacteroides sp.]
MKHPSFPYRFGRSGGFRFYVYGIAHTDYNFFGPKIGFDIFRFEDGKIVEHWDVIESILPEGQRANGNGKFEF